MSHTTVVQAAVAALLVSLAACDSRVDGVAPVGGDQASPVEQERFLGRLHLDLTGGRADASWIADGLAVLADDGDSAEVRAAIADPLIQSASFAELWVAELENGLFGGQTADDRYDLLCGIQRASEPACIACPPPSSGDACADCSCAALTSLFDERAALRTAAADLAADLSTSAIGRRYAATQVLRGLQDPSTTTTVLFEQFVGRPAEPEELRQGRAMIFGLALPGNPSGLLFHRHGTDFADLVDILFDSEAYREGQVAAVFQRYLGRLPTTGELDHFVGQLDADDPDIRGTVRAVVSSRDYFDQ